MTEWLARSLGRGWLGHWRKRWPWVAIGVLGAGVAVGCANAGNTVDDGSGTDLDSGLPPVNDAARPRDSGHVPDAGGPPPQDSGGPPPQDSGGPPPQDSGGPPPQDGGGPPPQDSGGNNCVHASNSVCGIVPQCDCTATQTCDVTNMTSGAAQCVGAGAKPQTQACGSTGDCAPGLTCYGGACRPYCNTPGQACPAAGTWTCSQRTQDGGTPIPNLEVCLFKCQLDDANACGGPQSSGPVAACVPLKAGGTDCRTAGTSTGNCDGNTLCAPANVCVTQTIFGQTTNTCFPWCKVAQNNCSGGTSCSSFTTKLTVDGVEYGFCQ